MAVTLILSLVTHDFVVQASDRRLTSPDGTLFEDEENKCIYYHLNASIAYTGLARLNGEPTADWALIPLTKGANLVTALESLRASATTTFRNLRRPGHLSQAQWRAILRTSFVCAGFGALRNPAALGFIDTHDHLHPFLSVTSNAELPNGSWKAEADLKFSRSFGWLASDQSASLKISGQLLYRSEAARLVRNLQKCLRHTRGPEASARILARQIREVSERNNAVGRSVVCSLVYRPDMTFAGGTLTMPGNLFPVNGHSIDEQTLFKRLPSQPGTADRSESTSSRYIYYPADLSQEVHYAPNWVMPDVAMKGMRFGPAVPGHVGGT
jgi:hypothetical protein